jgi:hypothetical protein
MVILSFGLTSPARAFESIAGIITIEHSRAKEQKKIFIAPGFLHSDAKVV